MPNRCVIAGCGGEPEPQHRTLIRILSDKYGTPDIEWVKFVHVWRPRWEPAATAHICSDHFHPSDFKNYKQFLMGFAHRLYIRPGVVPSIHPSKEKVDEYHRRQGNTHQDNSSNFDHWTSTGEHDKSHRSPKPRVVPEIKASPAASVKRNKGCVIIQAPSEANSTIQTTSCRKHDPDDRIAKKLSSSHDKCNDKKQSSDAWIVDKIKTEPMTPPQHEPNDQESDWSHHICTEEPCDIRQLEAVQAASNWETGTEAMVATALNSSDFDSNPAARSRMLNRATNESRKTAVLSERVSTNRTGADAQTNATLKSNKNKRKRKMIDDEAKKAAENAKKSKAKLIKKCQVPGVTRVSRIRRQYNRIDTRKLASVMIGRCYMKWKRVMEKEAITTDEEFAEFLLSTYEQHMFECVEKESKNKEEPLHEVDDNRRQIEKILPNEEPLTTTQHEPTCPEYSWSQCIKDEPSDIKRLEDREDERSSGTETASETSEHSDSNATALNPFPKLTIKESSKTPSMTSLLLEDRLCSIDSVKSLSSAEYQQIGCDENVDPAIIDGQNEETNSLETWCCTHNNDVFKAWLLVQRDLQGFVSHDELFNYALNFITTSIDREPLRKWSSTFLQNFHSFLRSKTSVIQSLPGDLEDKRLSFVDFIKNARDEYDLHMDYIINMDEIPLYFDVVRKNATVSSNDTETSGQVEASANHEPHLTLVLAVTAFGKVLPSMVIFKRKRPLNIKVPREWIVAVQEQASMNAELMSRWINEIYRPYTQNRTSLCILDSYHSHLADSVKENFKRCNAVMAVIPEGCTCRLQPLDISINKIVKRKLRNRWFSFFQTMATCIKHDWNQYIEWQTRQIIIDWIVAVMSEVSPTMVCKTFKVCGISNRKDGSEDHLVANSDFLSPDIFLEEVEELNIKGIFSENIVKSLQKNM